MSYDKAYALSLVRSNMLHDVHYLSWVPAYTVVRWCKRTRRSRYVTVGGHYRRKAMYAKALSALALTCKLQELVYPYDATRLAPPLQARRGRKAEDGSLVPSADRQLIFVD